MHRATAKRPHRGFLLAAIVSTLLLRFLLASAPSRASGAPPAVWIGAGHIAVSSVDIPADARQLASASAGDATIKIWDRAGTDLTRSLAGHLVGVNALDVTADGSLLASAADIAFGSGELNVSLQEL